VNSKKLESRRFERERGAEEVKTLVNWRAGGLRE
jgi:hypothetical protein